jgi:hypothetical protein
MAANPSFGLSVISKRTLPGFSYRACSAQNIALLTCPRTGYGNHGDYVFGWKDDSLQKIMDEECYVNCKTMKTQSVEAMNSCTVPNKVDEDIGDDNCKFCVISVR